MGATAFFENEPLQRSQTVVAAPPHRLPSFKNKLIALYWDIQLLIHPLKKFI